MSLVKEITSLLAQLTKGDKQDAMDYLQGAGFNSWNDVVNSEERLLMELKNKLTKLIGDDEYITVTIGAYKIHRPRDMYRRKVSDISFTFTGMRKY